MSFNTFFKGLSLHKIDEEMGVIYLTAESGPQKQFIQMKYLPTIGKHADKVLGLNSKGDNYKVVVKLADEYDKKEEKPEIKAKKIFKAEKLFNPKYNFDNFIVGDSNRYAHAAAVAVAEAPGEFSNPLFFYAGSGLGKTHLMQAIGVHIGRNNPSANVLYVSSEMFTNEFIESIKNGSKTTFDNKYRKVDVLLIDDIQFLEKKTQTQEEFFHVFETLYNKNKQIVISADCPPTQLKGIDERLRTRFAWNMIADISTPDYETRVAILRKLSEQANLDMDEDTYEFCGFIAEQVKDNIRELEGTFNRVVGFASLMNKKVTLEYAKYVLRDTIKENSDVVEPERIRQTVANYYNLKVADLDSKKRNAEINHPRQVAMYLCRTTTDMSFPKIGALFGGKNHATVMHSVNKIEEQLKYDDKLASDIDAILAKMNGKVL